MTTAVPQQKSVLEIILDWSRDRPQWQRDALRRIVQVQNLSETDIAQLVALCKRGRMESPPASDGKPHPLAASHLPANPGVGASVSLTAIKNVLAVNNLAPDQTLPFAPIGITVVYGDNAAGKSGYARILKRACRARHSEPILPNVYEAVPATLASATFCFRLGDKEQKPEPWNDTGRPQPQPHPVLSAINVFDANCANIHLKGKNEVAFRPFGLDVPDELANACKRVRAALEAEKRQHETIRNAIFSAPPWKGTTAVGKALAALTPTTHLAELEELAMLTEQEQAKLARLTEDLSKNPATAAAEQKLKADRVQRFREALSVIAVRTGPNALNSLIGLLADATAKQAAAQLAADGLFGTDFLPDVGGEVWRTVWEAARRYSTELAYPTDPFPPTKPNTLCVLCQQPLSPDAIQRMHQFETFIKEDTGRQAREVAERFETAARALAELTIGILPVADTLKEVGLHHKTLARAIRRALASARARRYIVQRRLAGHEQAAIPAAAPFPDDQLAALETDIRQYADVLQRAATGDERKALEDERQELADRAILQTQMAIIRDEIARLRAIRFLDACLADTTTNTITKLGNDIADEVLTPRLRDRFADEIINLVGASIRVEMVRTGGQYGSPQYQIRLLAKPDASVPDILSEGEQTCVAIAAFLAELATAPHNSALVFDDPITSLDHKWRHKVAERLVAEAAVRQVIVFTHDLIFLNDIAEAAQEAERPCVACHIRRSVAKIGMVNYDLPWEGMKITERIDALEKEARSLTQFRMHNDEQTYKRQAKHFYDDLRAAWERGLEEVAFAHVVMRHRDYIRGRDLLRVSALTAQDCQTWTDNFGKCSEYAAAHDESRGRNRAMPEPDEVLRDVEMLSGWVRDLRNRQNTVQIRSFPSASTAAAGQ